MIRNGIDQDVVLRIAEENELQKFKTDLQEAFTIAAEKELGCVSDGPIPPDVDIETSFQVPGSVVYQIIANGEIVGGAVVAIDEVSQHNKLLLFYVETTSQNRGIGYQAWKAIEKEHAETRIWETMTPYFEKRNIHFYVNKCKFKIVEYYNKHNPDFDQDFAVDDEDEDGMFRLQKVMQ
jgi:hypothetical protein